MHNGDTRDMLALRRVFEHEGEITSVVHLAGLKAAGEGVENPALYYDNKCAPPRAAPRLRCAPHAAPPAHPLTAPRHAAAWPGALTS